MLTILILSALLLSEPTEADIVGPGRFCGYSPIIDLLPGEKVTTLEGGIHQASFRWEGAFGSLDVRGIGWAARPKGRMIRAQTTKRPAQFAQRRVDQGYEVAIWNGSHGAAHFSSPKPLTVAQLKAISRVKLFEEGQTPPGCDLRTIFVFEIGP